VKRRAKAHRKSVLNKIYLLRSNETVRCRFVNEIFNFMFSALWFEDIYAVRKHIHSCICPCWVCVGWVHKFVNDFPLDNAANGRVYLLHIHILHQEIFWWAGFWAGAISGVILVVETTKWLLLLFISNHRHHVYASNGIGDCL